MKHVLLCLSLISLLSCKASVDANGLIPAGGGGGDGSPDPFELPYSSEVASGTIDGKAWQFKSGSITMGKDEANMAWVHLYSDENENPCWPKNESSSFYLKVSTDNEESRLSEATTQGTFVSVSSGAVAHMFGATGKIKMTEVTSESASGAIVASLDDVHTINGTFKLKWCGLR